MQFRKICLILHLDKQNGRGRFRGTEKTHNIMTELLEFLRKEKAELTNSDYTGENRGYVVIFRNYYYETVYALAKDTINLISEDAQDISPFTPINRVRVYKTFGEARDYTIAHPTIRDGRGRRFDSEVKSLEAYRELLLYKYEQEEEAIIRWLEEFKYRASEK